MTTIDSTLPSTPHGPDNLVPGTVVGSWRVEHELGRGGMGTVYAVSHVDIGKAAALKVVHREVLCDAFDASTILTEARAVNAFSHPNVVDIFESGAMADGRPYLVMERLRGRTLGDRHEESRVPALEAIDYLLPLCDVLAAAHAAGIIHRDIKLDNVFLVESRDPTGGTSRPEVKLLDWGVASMIDASGCRPRDSMTIGTPRYVAPEQVRGQGVTTASDIYALGVVAYELFLEEPPFTATTTSELLLAHVNEAPPAPHEVWPRIPKALEGLLLSMLAKDPAERPSAACVAAVLTEVRSELRQASTSVRPMSRAVARLMSHGGPSVRRATDATLQSLERFRPAKPWRWLAAAAMVAALFGARELIQSRAVVVSDASASAVAAMPVPVASSPTIAHEQRTASLSTAPRAAAPMLVHHSAATDAAPSEITSPRRTRQAASRAVSTRPAPRSLARASAPRRLDPNALVEPY